MLQVLQNQFFGYIIFRDRMDPELLNAINKRKKKFGGQQQPPAKVENVKITAASHTEGFGKNKQMLENFFAQKNQPASIAEVKKEQIKGDPKSFGNAKALLEQQFGKKPSNALNISPGIGQLPPPPSLDLLPPLPPPPPFSMSNCPLPPPPPLFPTNNLPLPPPPPPSFSFPTNNLPPPPPPPSFPTNILPPPPPAPSVNNRTNQGFNDLPPVPNRLTILQNMTNQGHQNTILPPPPPSLNNNAQINQGFNNNSPASSQKNTQINQGFNNYPPPPPPPAVNIDQPCFILSGGQKKQDKSSSNFNKTSNTPTEDISQNKKMGQSKKRKIFDERVAKKYNLTKQIFGKDIANLIRKEFIKAVNILEPIDYKIERKKIDQIHFPSIQNKTRNVEPHETIYADSEFLDLVGCFSTCKNLNLIKQHNDKKDKLIETVKSYNWESDPLKLKPMRQLVNNVPITSFETPNFVAIKNALNRAHSLMDTFVKNQQFEKCQQLKTLKLSIEKYLKDYCQNPNQNGHLLNQVYNLTDQVKKMNV